MDRKRKKSIHIDSKDLLSQDGQYVLIDGENPKKETQHIQKTEDDLTRRDDTIIEIEIVGNL